MEEKAADEDETPKGDEHLEEALKSREKARNSLVQIVK
jgi:hypothetical protein